ncbi:ImmA/IrrE family metallo-endopeptidase [Mesorhizobium sp. WSM4307]|uniref:XRE family transcriptional regulator n=1 Tax=unclassified Mesorhizobium TaxID=325217 RepID=UPI00115DEDD3|nr:MULTISPECIES: XRE family transcriptional regulator [unclassified Mesorhizobium]TRC73009.1 ImmA/IrrE family metallo-endopeptidase [Mesorhizobium sp. WSM4315]TRC74720.1 ImmA/IrrE family metallo-endopeptidase [Mesorhizobium sp. WSM4307]
MTTKGSAPGQGPAGRARFFYGDKLRLARLITGLSLDELGGLVAASRQFVHQLETGAKEPTDEMRDALAAALAVTSAFFATPATNPVREEDCHFRRLASAPRALIAQAVARGTALEALVDALEGQVRMPIVDFPEEARPASPDAIERIAENARQHWGLGLDGPITSMMRVVENAGAVVVHFDDLTDRIDALSMARRRPIIVRSTAKAAGARLRFDLAHEAAHLIMHQGIVTGDSVTEGEAHRFAGAFLIPRTAFAREFPRSRRALDWNALFTMKLRWKVSVRAIARRAFDLGLIDAAQYRTANIQLVKTGQAKAERYDERVAVEEPELLRAAISWVSNRDTIFMHHLLANLGMAPELFARLTGERMPTLPDNVVPLGMAKLL